MEYESNDRIQSRDMPASLRGDVDRLLTVFDDVLVSLTNKHRLRGTIARSLSSLSLLAILDNENLFIVGQSVLESPRIQYFYRPKVSMHPDRVLEAARQQFGYNDPYLIVFPAHLIEQNKNELRVSLEPFALSHIDSELQRSKTKASVGAGAASGKHEFTVTVGLLLVLTVSSFFVLDILTKDFWLDLTLSLTLLAVILGFIAIHPRQTKT